MKHTDTDDKEPDRLARAVSKKLPSVWIKRIGEHFDGEPIYVAYTERLKDPACTRYVPYDAAIRAMEVAAHEYDSEWNSISLEEILDAELEKWKGKP